MLRLRGGGSPGALLGGLSAPKLPKLESLQGVDVDISDSSLQLRAEGKYRLQLAWPQEVCSDAAKAKFVKKSRSLQLRIPAK